MTDYSNASVVITGASRGIGRHIALEFARRTDRPLILIARDEAALEKTKSLIAGYGQNAVHIFSLDATEPGHVWGIKRDHFKHEPGIIVNNAGNFLHKELLDTSYNEFQQQLKANLFTAVNVTNRFLHSLQKIDRGLIINICSVGALKGLPESGAYSASKHALLGYTRSLREELKHTQVGITAINLGQTESHSWNDADIKRDLLINPEDVGKLIVDLTQLSARTLVEEILIQPQHGTVPPMGYKPSKHENGTNEGRFKPN